MRMMISVENTVGDYTGALRRWLVGQGTDQAKYPMGEPQSADYTDPSWPFAPGDHAKLMADPQRRADIYRHMRAYAHAAPTLRTLLDSGHQILFVARHYCDGNTAAYWWLREHMGELLDHKNCLGVASLSNRVELARRQRIRLAVDDDPQWINSLAASGIRVIKPARAYNLRAQAEPFTGWASLPDTISSPQAVPHATVMIDIDNTMGDYTGALREYLRTREQVSDRLPMPTPSRYSYTGHGWPFADRSGYQRAHARAVAAGLYLRERPLPHMVKAIHQITKAGHRIAFATSRADDKRADTYTWLEHLFGQYFLQSAQCAGIYMGDKRTIALVCGAEIAIEDNPRTIDDLSRWGLSIIRPALPYCARSTGFRFDDWRQVPMLVDSAMRNRVRLGIPRTIAQGDQ